MSFDPTITERYPEIPWRNIRDLGNVTRHDDENVGVETVWETVTSCKLRALMSIALAELETFDA